MVAPVAGQHVALAVVQPLRGARGSAGRQETAANRPAAVAPGAGRTAGERPANPGGPGGVPGRVYPGRVQEPVGHLASRRLPDLPVLRIPLPRPERRAAGTRSTA